jgi:DNA repair photolyase
MIAPVIIHVTTMQLDSILGAMAFENMNKYGAGDLPEQRMLRSILEPLSRKLKTKLENWEYKEAHRLNDSKKGKVYKVTLKYHEAYAWQKFLRANIAYLECDYAINSAWALSDILHQEIQ